MPLELSAWKALEVHYKNWNKSLTDLFAQDSHRAADFSGAIAGLQIDYSKNLITKETLSLLIKLAEERQLPLQIQKLFSGDVVNQSEKQPALHTQARAQEKNAINQVLEKMQSVSENIRSQTWKSATNQTFTDIIHLGTGGSYLGPHMTMKALSSFVDSPIHFHFFANQQDNILNRLLSSLNPQTTLVIVSSKSFSTNETLHNFEKVLDWLKTKISPMGLSHHLIAITANASKVRHFPIAEERIIEFSNYIGGRYSIWSAVGLPLCIAMGFPAFQDFLRGASEVDNHFIEKPLSENIPALLGLIELWYIHFFNANSLSILAYHQDLSLLPRYLQQLCMESLGKSVDQHGTPLTYPTGKVLWGGTGSTGQHAYHQLLHQGNAFIPCDFIVTYDDLFLFSQCLAQSQAMMLGDSNGDPSRLCEGNRPSNIYVLPKLTPYHLGTLLACYEHKIYTQAVIWNINPFDQWGVEHGKQLGQELKRVVEYGELPPACESSTRKLLENYYQWTATE